MPDLEMEVVPARLGVIPRLVNAVEVAVNPVHRGSANVLPTAAVDPRAPLPRASYADLGASDIPCQLCERINVERGAVKQAEVEV